jgi:uncharacterized protein
MLFVVYSLDDPETGKEIRRRTRPAHLRYVRDNRDVFHYGGSLRGEHGEMIGTLALIEAPDRAAVVQFLKNDPYNHANLFKTVIVNETRQTLPETSPGSLDDEIAELGIQAAG